MRGDDVSQSLLRRWAASPPVQLLCHAYVDEMHCAHAQECCDTLRASMCADEALLLQTMITVRLPRTKVLAVSAHSVRYVDRRSVYHRHQCRSKPRHNPAQHQ